MPAQPTFNRVLSALAQADQLPWTEQLELVELSARDVLHAQGVVALHIYFPTSALVVLMQTADGGGEVPVALVGNDGVVEVAALLGAGVETNRAVVLQPGFAWRVPTSAVSAAGVGADQVVRVTVAHMLSLASQVSQTASCQKHHGVEQRLSRWLLTALDRLPEDELAIDLAELAPLLAVSNGELTEAAAQLMGLGALECEPGRLVVPDRALLQARSCGCHAPAKGMYYRKPLHQN
ncbi:MAG: hypothetical protein Q7V46_06015 [Hydrogenophaga sp.]|nr:hypothetical protein [Hydrogenophaga sp.]